MDYKEKYEKALNRAKVINPGTADYEVAVKIFPELKENEDEKVRKEIIQSIQDNMCVIHKDKCIAWLEKQGEQQSTNDAKPKFKVGDWIVQEGVGTYKIIEVCGWYEIIGIDGNQYSISFLWENDCRLWTIQDAKDGDVLVSESKCGLNTWYCIFKSLDDDESMTVHCYIGRDGRFQAMEELCFNKDPRDVKPATKEQRDLLFQKMKEAGYEWNTEKKELEKIEQKPAAYFYCKYGGIIPKCSDCVRNHLNSKYKTEEIKTWMIPAARGTKQCFSYIQQKPAGWSEEDEKNA